MAGELILVVDDTPINLKLTRMLLLDEGYQVLTASTADEALGLLRSNHPQLVLADIQLKGMDGLQLTRRIKRDAATRDITVIALTAFAMAGDEGRALDAGCDGYITKPIDTRTLGERIREILATRAEAQAAALSGDTAPAKTSGAASSISPSELLGLRRNFLGEGLDLARQMLVDLDSQFNAAEAARLLHNWVGTGGLLGCTAISRLAREAESILELPPLDTTQLRDSLTNLVLAFSSPFEARDEVVPEPILLALSGRKIAVVGFPRAELQGLAAALQQAGATPVVLELVRGARCRLGARLRPGGGPRGRQNLALAVARRCRFRAPPIVPCILAGTRDHLLALGQSVQSMAREYLMDSWLPEEALVRFTLALSPRPKSSEAAVSAPQRPRDAHRGPRAGPGGRRRFHRAAPGPHGVAELRNGLPERLGRSPGPGNDPPVAAARGGAGRQHAGHGRIRRAGDRPPGRHPRCSSSC